MFVNSCGVQLSKCFIIFMSTYWRHKSINIKQITLQILHYTAVN